MTIVTNTTTTSGDGILFTQEDSNLTISVNDEVTMQGNEFNGANELVRLDEYGALPSVDGSKLTGLSSFTSNTCDMPTMANNSTDLANDIDFTDGFCYDLATKEKIVCIAMTKRLDAVFATGINAGGLDSGTIAINTWYHCFAISRADGTSDFLFSTSADSPTMPTGFVNKRRIGSVKTDSNSGIVPFYQNGTIFLYLSRVTEYAYGGPGWSSETALSLHVPPSVLIRPILMIWNYYATGNAEIMVGSSLVPVQTVTLSYTTVDTVHVDYIPTNNGQILVKGLTSGVGIFTKGYIDKRGAK